MIRTLIDFFDSTFAIVGVCFLLAVVIVFVLIVAGVFDDDRQNL